MIYGVALIFCYSKLMQEDGVEITYS